MKSDKSPMTGHGAPDDFEDRLARVPGRRAPAELRAEVLAAAKRVEPAKLKRSDPENMGARPLRMSWGDWLLAHFPLAPGGLAACWLLIWLGGSADRLVNGSDATKPVVISREQMAEARAQRAELRQLAGLDDPAGKIQSPAPERTRLEAPALPARPRSDRRRSRDDGFGIVPDSSPVQVAATGRRSTESAPVSA